MIPELIDRLRGDLDAADYRVGEVAALLGSTADAARQRGVLAPARRALRERGESALATLIRVLLLGEAAGDAEIDAALPTLGARGALELGLMQREGSGACRAALSLNPVEIVDALGEEPPHWWILSDLDDQLRRGPARPDHVMGVGGATRSLIAQAPLGPRPSGIGDPAALDSAGFDAAGFDAAGLDRAEFDAAGLISAEIDRAGIDPAASDRAVLDSRAALDLGTGCGVVALHLARAGMSRVIATDISERALMLARANARLNGVGHGIEFRRGDLFEPVAEERFDLILSNPPFVITPREADAPVYEYRDGGMAGDGLAERVVREAPALLAEGGALLCLANWESPWGANGLDRVRGWIEGAAETTGPLDAWVIERDRVDPAQYAETWARDGGARPGSPEFERLMDSWLEDFAARRIVAVGLGSIRVRRPRREEEVRGSVVHAEQATGAFGIEARGVEALGSRLAAAFDAGVAAERMSDDEALATRWLLAAAVVEEREHQPGEEAPRAIALTTDHPVARRVTADPLLAAAVGACDGDLTLAQIADALATLLEVDAAAAGEALLAGTRELAWLGMLTPSAR